MTAIVDAAPGASRRSQKWFARLWSWLDDTVDETVATAKDAIYSNLPARIVEIGPGRGSNFKRYEPGTTVIAFEPNRFMHDDLRTAAAEYGIKLDLRDHGVEDMDLADQSEDAVVSSFTLCSVEDIGIAVTEIRRVLKPGGRFLFVEHIAAGEGTILSRAQAVLRRPWAALFDRCDLMANTHRAIERSGFAEVSSEIRGFGPKADPSRRTLFGSAIR